MGTYGRIGIFLCLQKAPRSSLALNFGVDVLAGVVDSDYRGEIRVILLNTGTEPVVLSPGDRIAQLIVEKIADLCVTEVSSLPTTVRGEGGFGSTGK